MSFLDSMIEKAQATNKTIVLPEGKDERVLEAAAKLLEKKIVDVIIIGKKSEIQNSSMKENLSGAVFIDPNDYSYYDAFVESFVNLRKHKFASEQQAREKAGILMRQVMYIGVMMVKHGYADGMVGGACHSTPDTLRPALQILKTAPGVRRVSSFFLMLLPDQSLGHKGAFVFSDCGLNEDPDAEALADIAVSSAKSFTMLTGASAKVAMLSYSSHGSASSPMTKKVVDATRIARERAPDLCLDGELQVDAAIDPLTSASKAPQSVVGGQANVLIFPDLNAGNIGYKLVQRLAHAEALGPVTQGIAAPVNDLSRGCSTDDIVGVAAITALQAENQ